MQHLDECLFGIRKCQKTYVDLIPQDVAILDEMFTQLVTIVAHQRREGTEVDPSTLDTLLSYVQGKSPTHGTSWIDARAVYMPLNIRDNHWVVKIDLEEYEFILFDCSLDSSIESHIQSVMEPLQLVTPYLLHKTG